MDAKPAVLVVEDEAAIRTGVCDALAFYGYTAVGVGCGKDGLRRALDERYALVVLDIMLPGMSGFDVCRELRTRRPAQAILLLTALGAEEDVLKGFCCGADDYVTKPFSVAEFAARVQALLRRAGFFLEQTREPFECGPWRIDPAAATAVCQTSTVTLTAREVVLLALFAQEAGRIISRRRLLADVWGLRHVDRIRTRTVDVHIAKLRRKLAVHSAEAIETVRGEGYRFVL